jgi:hypothetical protein
VWNFWRFCIVTPCNLVEVYQRFRVICYLHYQSTQIMGTAVSSEALVCTFLLEHTASHGLRHECLPYLVSCRIYFIPCNKACDETGKINVIIPYTIQREALERAEIAGRDKCCCDRTFVLIQPCWVHTVICVHSSRTWREQIIVNYAAWRFINISTVA